MFPQVLAVSLSPTYSFSKTPAPEIIVKAGLGVEGDAHAGALVRHRYRVRRDPTAPNLCQVHLLHAELFPALARQGIDLSPGQMGENITTTGIDLLALPRGTRLLFGRSAVLEVTGLRDPCVLMNGLHPGLMQACLARDSNNALIRKAGIMSIVLASGPIRPGDPIGIELPTGPLESLHAV